MGLLDFINKAKETVVAAKDKAVQTVKDNKQIREEADIEAKKWKSFDPLILKNVLRDNNEHAADLYAKQTGCTPEKAKVVINRIKRSVKEEYPSILHAQACAADMEAIKDAWPFGNDEFDMYMIWKEKDDDEDEQIPIFSARLQTNGEGKYTIQATHLTAFKSKKEFNWEAIFKNGKMYLKDESGSVIMVDSFAFDFDSSATLLFNPEDERYKAITSKIESAKKIKSLHLYRKDDFDRFQKGEMDKETLTSIADNFTFTFKDNAIYSNGCNIGVLFKDAFFFRRILANDEKKSFCSFLDSQVYDYIDSYGVKYAWDDQDFEEQFDQFDQEVDMDYDFDRVYWNLHVYGAAGMVYQGLSKRIELSSLPRKLGALAWNDNKKEYSFVVRDSIFNYYYDMPDERPLLDRVIGYNDDAAEAVANSYTNFQESTKNVISQVLETIRIEMSIEDEKLVTLDCCGNTYCGFLEEVEYDYASKIETE